MKKIMIAALTLLTLLFPVSLSAEEQIPTDADDPAPSVAAASYDVLSHCICGREYYGEDGSGHSMFDCERCGKNMYSCTCNCWCGAEKILSDSETYLCAGCGLPCINCSCRSDRDAVIAAEKQVIAGNITSLRVLSPKTGWVAVSAVVLSFGLLAAVLCLREKIFGLLTEKQTKPTPSVSDTPRTESAEKRKEIFPKQSSDTKMNEGAFALYQTISKLSFGMKKSKDNNPGFRELPKCDLIVAREEIGLLMRIAVVSPGKLCPLKTADCTDEKAYIEGLLNDGIIGEDGDRYGISSPFDEYIHHLAAPDLRLSLEYFARGLKADFCEKDGAWYLVTHEEDAEKIYAFSNADDARRFIAEYMDPVSPPSGDFMPCDYTVSYGQFALICQASLIAMRDGKEAFTVESLGSPALIGTMAAYISGYPRFTEFYRSLKNSEIREKLCGELISSGLFAERDGASAFSEKAEQTLCIRDLSELVHITCAKQNMNSEILFAVHRNGGCIIGGSGSSVRVVTSKGIPWKNYIK